MASPYLFLACIFLASKLASQIIPTHTRPLYRITSSLSYFVGTRRSSSSKQLRTTLICGLASPSAITRLTIIKPSATGLQRLMSFLTTRQWHTKTVLGAALLERHQNSKSGTVFMKPASPSNASDFWISVTEAHLCCGSTSVRKYAQTPNYCVWLRRAVCVNENETPLSFN